MAYAHSAGIIDRGVQCDLNKWDAEQKRAIGAIVAQQVRISGVSRVYLGYIPQDVIGSTAALVCISRLYLGSISALSRLYLVSISALSRLYTAGRDLLDGGAGLSGPQHH